MRFKIPCFTAIRCNKCALFDDCQITIKKPNFWLYLAGDLILCFVTVFFMWLAFKLENPGFAFISGGFSVLSSDLMYEYHNRMREYNRYIVNDRENNPVK